MSLLTLFGSMLKCVHLVDLRHHAAFVGFYRDHFESDINVCNMNNVDSDHGHLIDIHLVLLYCIVLSTLSYLSM